MIIPVCGGDQNVACAIMLEIIDLYLVRKKETWKWWRRSQTPAGRTFSFVTTALSACRGGRHFTAPFWIVAAAWDSIWVAVFRGPLSLDGADGRVSIAFDLIASASPWMSRSVVICSPPPTRPPTCPLIAGWTRPRWVPFQIWEIRLPLVAWSRPIIHEKKRWKQVGHEPRRRSDRETRQRFAYPFTRYPLSERGSAGSMSNVQSIARWWAEMGTAPACGKVYSLSCKYNTQSQASAKERLK